MFGFETPTQKRIRLLEHDIEQERKRKEAEAEGHIYIGTRYEDDYRENKNL